MTTKQDDLFSMIDELAEKVDEPMVRRFAIECCRLVWDKLNPISRDAVEAAERFLTGSATEDELAQANNIVGDFCDQAETGDEVIAACTAIHASYWRAEIEEVEDICQNLLSLGVSENQLRDLLSAVVNA